MVRSDQPRDRTTMNSINCVVGRLVAFVCLGSMSLFDPGCGTAVQTGQGGEVHAPPAIPNTWKKVDPDFPRREGAIYRGLEGSRLYCTLATNLPAATAWLKVLTNVDESKLSTGQLLAVIQKALSQADQVGEWELADLGWLVGLRLNHEVGGSLAWDENASEVYLQLPKDKRLYPMRVIAEAYEGRMALPALLVVEGARREPQIDCRTLTTLDVLGQRARLAADGSKRHRFR
jgi:hypothetical protein